MKVLGISSDEQRAFWLVLGAIYHLGAAGATKGKIAEQTKCIQLLHDASLIWEDNVIHEIPGNSNKEAEGHYYI